MSTPSEQQVAIPVGDDSLYGVLYRPVGEPAAAIVVCAPLLEERKASHRVLVETARALAAEGVAVLRFDYRGCGDSPGEFPDFAFDSWLADIAAARAYLTGQFPNVTVGLFGLRLGASLAALAAPAFLLLWEPVVSGKAYVNQLFRQMLVKEMMTYGKGTRSRADVIATLEGGGEIDADGFALTSQLYRDVSGIDLADAPPSPAGPVFMLNIGTSEEPSRPLANVGSRLRVGGADVTLQGLRMPPLWSLVGFVDYAPVIEATVEWARHQVISAQHE